MSKFEFLNLFVALLQEANVKQKSFQYEIKAVFTYSLIDVDLIKNIIQITDYTFGITL